MRRLPVSIPPWADRVGLAMIGGWLFAMGAARLLQGFDALLTTGGLLQSPLGDWPRQIEVGVNLLGLVLPSTFIMLGPALWEDPAKRPRFLAACAFADVWLLSMLAVQIAGPLSATASAVVANAQAALLLAAAASLAWTTRRARTLVLVGATATLGATGLTAAIAANAAWLAGIEATSTAIVWALRGISVGAVGLALLWPAKWKPLRPRHDAAALPETS